jgi:hypothetical protein
VSTLTETTSAGSYTADPDTGYLRYCLWAESSDAPEKYPDIGTMTVTVQGSGGSSVWEPAVDKYSFITDRTEYAVDVYQDQLDANGNAIEDAVYVIFNTGPFSSSNLVMFTFGNINPKTNFYAMQPSVDNQQGYQHSLFGFEQWLEPNAKVRKQRAPNAFLLAFPGVLSDFSITEGGLLQETQGKFWTVPPPYSPQIVEHDVIIRKSTGERFQVVNYTPIYIEDILVSQHLDMAELDPRSSIYSVSFETGL